MVMCWRVSAHTYTLMHCNSQSRLYIGTLPVCTVHFHVVGVVLFGLQKLSEPEEDAPCSRMGLDCWVLVMELLKTQVQESQTTAIPVSTGVCFCVLTSQL